MGNLIFKGIQQVYASGFTADNATNGVLYFVRNAATGDADIYFGKKHYGSLNASQIASLQASIKKNADDITAIETLLGDFTGQFTENIKTIAQVTKANADAISALSGEGEGSVAKAVADAKSELLGDAGNDYNTLGKLEDEIQAVAKSVTDKNVSAEGDGYVTATANENKVTVAASESTKASLALADSALQKADIATGTAKGTIKVDDTDVAVNGLGSAAYTDSSDYDESGAADAVKTELLGTTKDGDATTIAALNTKIEGVAAAAKSYEIKAITTGLSSNVKEAYGLFDEAGVQAGAVINIYKDSSLKEVKLSGQSLMFTYILNDGTESTVGVDVSDFLAESEFKNGLTVSDNGEVSVLVDSTSESFLSVSANGVKLSGVQDAINTGVASAKTYTDETKNTLNAAITNLTNTFTSYTGDTDTTLTGLRNDINDVSGAVANHKTETTEAIKTAKEEATAYTYNAITAETSARTEAFDTLSAAVDTKVDKTTYNTYTSKTDSVLESIKNDLTAITAITSNAVTSIASTGKTITVVNTDGKVNVEVNTLPVATAQASGYVALETTANGELYGVMYYGGDDAE